jgi:serine/threonine protein phosphatase PrpC
MGATLTAALIERTEAYIVEVGDSRAYLLRAGELPQLTRDQSLVQMLVDAGQLSPEEARHSPQKNVILQSIGLADDLRVAIGRLQLRRGDTILICCDGLSNAITDDEIRRILGANDPTGACAGLIDLANERGGKDNLTAIVARLDGSDLLPASPHESVTATFDVLRAFTPVDAPCSG